MIKFKKYLLILGVFFSCHLFTSTESSIFYLPENFEGFIAVVYSQDNGLSEVSGGKRIYHVPSNGILLTADRFKADITNELFLMKNGGSFDTLKSYLPVPDFSAMNFDTIEFYKKYTRDSNAVAVNKREIRKPTFYRYDDRGEKVGECTFNYQLIVIGRASTLSDSLGKTFVENLDNYFHNKLCK